LSKALSLQHDNRQEQAEHSELSVRNWEHLTIECGWSTSQYIASMQTLLKRTFVRGSEGTYSAEQIV